MNEPQSRRERESLPDSVMELSDRDRNKVRNTEYSTVTSTKSACVRACVQPAGLDDGIFHSAVSMSRMYTKLVVFQEGTELD